MIQDVVDQMKAERDRLKAEGDRLNELIAKAEEIQRYIAYVPHGIQEDPPELMRNAEGESAAIQGLGTAEAAARLIKGEPATTHKILYLLERHGHKVGGKKPLVTLYSALKRSKVIRRFPDKKWGNLL